MLASCARRGGDKRRLRAAVQPGAVRGAFYLRRPALRAGAGEGAGRGRRALHRQSGSPARRQWRHHLRGHPFRHQRRLVGCLPPDVLLSHAPKQCLCRGVHMGILARARRGWGCGQWGRAVRTRNAARRSLAAALLVLPAAAARARLIATDLRRRAVRLVDLDGIVVGPAPLVLVVPPLLVVPR